VLATAKHWSAAEQQILLRAGRDAYIERDPDATSLCRFGKNKRARSGRRNCRARGDRFESGVEVTRVTDVSSLRGRAGSRTQAICGAQGDFISGQSLLQSGRGARTPSS